MVSVEASKSAFSPSSVLDFALRVCEPLSLAATPVLLVAKSTISGSTENMSPGFSRYEGCINYPAALAIFPGQTPDTLSNLPSSR